MSVNKILLHEITKVTSSILPDNFNGSAHEMRVVRELLTEVIDRLGSHSAAAQGLSKVITTAEKMRLSPSYAVYLLKDASANQGRGEVVGLLKVGKKHLYLTDEQARLHEVEPWCVLDFFVEPTLQRHGLGKKLFDYMLQDMKLPAKYVAVDGPSPAMIKFLAKNYGLDNMIKQSNNFALPKTFFENLTEIRAASGASTPAAVATGAGRFTAAQPRSAIGTIIHGGGPAQEISVSRPEREREREWEVKSPAAELTPQPASREETPSAEEEVEAPSTEEAVEKNACREGEGEGEGRAAERPRSLPVSAAAAAEASPAAASPAGSVLSRRDSQLTDKGFFDVKFYHNKLW